MALFVVEVSVVLCFFPATISAELQRFEHPAKNDGSLSFLVVGDWGRRGNYNQSKVAYQMGRIGDKLDIDFVISTSDNFYDNGLDGVEDAHFAASFMNIYTAKSLQKQWYRDLDSALKESSSWWKIIVGHHAIRSVGHHGDTEELVQCLLPKLKAYNVDFYMNEHDHCLEHISDNGSPIQFLTRGAGSKSWRGDARDKQEGLHFYCDGQGLMSV